MNLLHTLASHPSTDLFHQLLDKLILLSGLDKNRCILMSGQDKKKRPETIIEINPAVRRVQTIALRQTLFGLSQYLLLCIISGSIL